MNPLIQSLTEGQLRTDIPSFRPGDTVRVHAKVVEGNRSEERRVGKECRR